MAIKRIEICQCVLCGKKGIDIASAGYEDCNLIPHYHIFDSSHYTKAHAALLKDINPKGRKIVYNKKDNSIEDKGYIRVKKIKPYKFNNLIKENYVNKRNYNKRSKKTFVTFIRLYRKIRTIRFCY